MTRPIAFSYIRFSHADQSKGDSLRRQTEAAAAWCDRHNVTLDAATTLHDLGKSAYTGSHRENPDRHALAGFLKLVENGKIPRGSYLIIENLDRLSREHVQPALQLALSLLQAGVRLVQLKPNELVFDDKSDMLPLMMMLMELSRGHGESAIKSERVGAAWREKKRLARATGEVLTRRLPAWVEESGGKLRLIPDRTAIIRRIFQLSASGYGLFLIAKKFNSEGVATFGDAEHWGRSYLGRITKDRRVLGEYQPRKRGGSPDGEPIPEYFPPAVTEDEFHAARAAAGIREIKRGRAGKYIELFSGLLRCARNQGTYFITTADTAGGVPRRVLRNSKAALGVGEGTSFPLATFEAAILSCLSEIDPDEILNGDNGPDESLALAGELASVESKIAELEAELLNGDVAALARVLRTQEERRRTLSQQLAAARQKAAHPLSEAWGETKSLLQVLASAPDPADARLRLRAALRRIVDSVWLLVIPLGAQRLCAVQIWFADRKHHRDYLILHTPPKANAKARVDGRWEVKSLADVVALGSLDLRKPAHAKRLEAVLEKLSGE